MTHPFKSQSKSGQQMAKARYADGGKVGDAKFMMNYDKNSGGKMMKADMAAAERISDAVPRGEKKYADGGSVKDATRYGDGAANVSDNSKPNEWEGRMLLGPPRTPNTPGYDTDTSSTRRKKQGA